MKTSKQKIVKEDGENSSEKTLDLFAGDFFGVDDEPRAEPSAHVKSLRAVSVKPGAKVHSGSDWSKSLPKISHQETVFSNQILELPARFDEFAGDGLKTVFYGLTRIAKKNITFERLAVSEVNLRGAVRQLETGAHCYLTVADKLSQLKLLLAVETEFAASLIDLILGGSGQASEILRPLSPIELTILEYLSARILGEINQPSVRFTLRSVDNEFTGDLKPFERGGEIVLALKIGDLSGQVTLHLPAEFLRTPADSAGDVFGQDSADLQFAGLKRILSGFDLKIQVGETRIRGIDLPYLERDDVILIEKPLQIWHNGSTEVTLKDVLSIYVGSGTNFRFGGILQNVPTGTGVDAEIGEISVKINEIDSERIISEQPAREKMETKKKKTDETGNDPAALSDELPENAADVPENEPEIADVADGELDEAIDEETLATLENVLVNLRVQIGGRRLSLDELRKIRVGQILDLGCRPNDPVEIVTDHENKPIATGELVLIEEQLGVRLTKIFI